VTFVPKTSISLPTRARQLTEDSLIRGESLFPVSLTLITAITILGISIAAILSMVLHIGLF
jgi:putative membrane protein